jgi:hypothetical protein
LQIALAEIFPGLDVVRIERQRLVVIVDALVEIAELARVVADHVQDGRLRLLLDAGEQRERLAIAAVVGAGMGLAVEILIGQRRRMLVDAGLDPSAPDAARCATDLGAALLLDAVFVAGGTSTLGRLWRLVVAAISFGHGAASRQGERGDQHHDVEPQAPDTSHRPRMSRHD